MKEKFDNFFKDYGAYLLLLLVFGSIIIVIGYAVVTPQLLTPTTTDPNNEKYTVVNVSEQNIPIQRGALFWRAEYAEIKLFNTAHPDGLLLFNNSLRAYRTPLNVKLEQGTNTFYINFDGNVQQRVIVFDPGAVIVKEPGFGFLLAVAGLLGVFFWRRQRR